jgi:DNA-binding NarL/FixJ family response regulator
MHPIPAVAAWLLIGHSARNMRPFHRLHLRAASEETMPARSVLIVEDEATARIGYEAIVAESGYKLAGSSGSATEAWRSAEASPPSVAVVDVKPGPHSDGLWVAQQLAKQFDTRLVLITATESPDVLGAASLIGPVALLRKPVLPAQVIQAIDEAMPPDMSQARD